MISLMINDDIDAIIQRGEEHTVELNSNDGSRSTGEEGFKI
jgi:hypothetical protein